MISTVSQTASGATSKQLTNRPTYARINWANLRSNYQIAKAQAPGAAYAVIKANGYGHGIVACARALGEADGFAVACVDEAMALRQAGIKRPVVVLQGAYCSKEWQLASDNDLQLVVQHPQQLQQRAELVLPNPVAVWLKINSGMNRVGVRADEAQALIDLIDADEQLQLRLVMTHFADADQGSDAALADAIQVMQSQSWPVPLSVSNSAATLTGLASVLETPDSVSRRAFYCMARHRCLIKVPLSWV